MSGPIQFSDHVEGSGAAFYKVADSLGLEGIQVKPGTQWLKPGLVGRVRHLKGEQLLRHATLREIRD